MMIIIEGIDATGKSTLANRLAKATGYPVIGSEGPEKSPGEIIERCRRYLDNPDERVIYDRHPVISQSIYSQFTHGTPVPQEFLDELRKKNPLIILSSPNNKGEHIIKEHDTLFHVEMVAKNRDRLGFAYSRFFNTHQLSSYPTMIFNFGYEDLIVQYVLQMLREKHPDAPPDFYRDLQNFHRKFGFPRPPRPTLLPQDLMDFRVKFLQEELDEMVKAYNEKDMAEVFDGLIDLVYVALGTAELMGLPFNEGWNEVHQTNMAKKRANSTDPSSRAWQFNIIKPEGWRPPDLDFVLRKASGE